MALPRRQARGGRGSDSRRRHSLSIQPGQPSPPRKFHNPALCGARACQTYCVNLCSAAPPGGGPSLESAFTSTRSGRCAPRTHTAGPRGHRQALGALQQEERPPPRAESGALSVVRLLGAQLPLWDRQAGSGSLARPLPRSWFWPIGDVSRRLEGGVEWGAGIRPPGSSLGCSNRVSHFLCPDALTPRACSL